MDCIPVPVVCFQCGTDQNPCHCKVVGPTIGFLVTVGMAVSTMYMLVPVPGLTGMHRAFWAMMVLIFPDRLLARKSFLLLLRVRHREKVRR